jgi:hypothetical protein
MFLIQVDNEIGGSQRCRQKNYLEINLSFSIKKCNRPPERASKLQEMPPALQRKQSPLQYIFEISSPFLYFQNWKYRLG